MNLPTTKKRRIFFEENGANLFDQAVWNARFEQMYVPWLTNEPKLQELTGCLDYDTSTLGHSMRISANTAAFHFMIGFG